MKPTTATLVSTTRTSLLPTPLRFAPPADEEGTVLHTRIQELTDQVQAQQARIAELTMRSHTDELTGLASAKGFQHTLRHLVTDHLRYGYQGALIGLNLKGFSHINARLGRAGGDAVLVHVARLLARQVRETDTLARLHGDTFMLILKEADAGQANSRAQQLATLLDTEPCHVQAAVGLRRVKLAAAIGVATVAEAPSVEAVTALAERRMYQSKTASGQGAFLPSATTRS